MHKVYINGQVLFSEHNELLSHVLVKAGQGAEHPCGGRGVCKKCTVLVNGKEELSCRYRVNADICVEVPQIYDVVSKTGVAEAECSAESTFLVLDIGTTTLAMCAVCENKEAVKAVTRTNPQRVFGADVISRIDYCTKNGPTELKNALIKKINEMVNELNLSEAVKLYVTGNTVMLHLFFGADCSGMGIAPYKPVFLESRTGTGESLGLNGVSTVESLPCVNAFLGADIVAGVNYVGFSKNGKYNLLVDLGTNAEVVLFNARGALCTSAAAGPCFEGANISCGMSAVRGAVYSYSQTHMKTVEDAPPKGICGTGLVDAVAELLNKGVIDTTGYMECGTYELAEGITLNQKDVRQYQLAKGAVYSAIMTLLHIKGITFDDVERVYVSGGFSSEMNITNAVNTGLLPAGARDKCVAVNNSSLLGAVKYACEKNDLGEFVSNATYVDLSANEFFVKLFIESMDF